MPAPIAGHTFVFGRCECGRHWADIRNVTEADINAKGIAHIEQLTPSEYAQIVEARTAEDKAYEMAMGSL